MIKRHDFSLRSKNNPFWPVSINSFDDTRFWIGFSVFPGIGPVRFKLLLDYFGSAKLAWEAPLSKLLEVKLGEKRSRDFDDFRKSFVIEDYRALLENLHISVLTLTDDKYPPLLKQIPDAPFVLYIKGKKPYVPIRLDRTIGIVGTRKVTPYGREVTKRLTEELVAAGFTIVSGLAYGVDAVAHQTTINSEGNTIAVLGCGIDIIAPASNTSLYHAIANGHGAIVSEMPLGLRPGKGLFPARNRIISGLSLGVVVTEGADDSGALITARYAAEQGREVFAVPGPVTSPLSRGPLKLLKNGAKLVESATDILEELRVKFTNLTNVTNTYQAQNREEQKILDIIHDQRKHIDELVRESGLTMPEVAATLTVLEVKGVVRDYGEKIYGIL